MRYHFFLHYGWFFQNLGKEAVRTFMHTTVYQETKYVSILNFQMRFRDSSKEVNSKQHMFSVQTLLSNHFKGLSSLLLKLEFPVLNKHESTEHLIFKWMSRHWGKIVQENQQGVLNSHFWFEKILKEHRTYDNAPPETFSPHCDILSFFSLSCTPLNFPFFPSLLSALYVHVAVTDIRYVFYVSTAGSLQRMNIF